MYVYVFRPLPEVKSMTVSFFILIRDIICSTWEYRMNMTALTERVLEWVKSTLNYRRKPDWYHSLALKTWPKALQSAIGFLAGHFPGKQNFFSVFNINIIMTITYMIISFRVATRRLCSFH